MKKAVFAVLGLLQGAIGSWWVLLGWAFAFPESKAGSKDYEEDLAFIPFGYIMMLAWVLVMAYAVIRLRKNKGELISFLAAWAAGTAALIIIGLMKIDISAMLFD